MIPSVAYYRTSSHANVGDDKDSLPRQSSKVLAYAQANGTDIVKTFYDAGVRGTVPIHKRPEFKKLLAYAIENGIKRILVESSSRFSRDLMIQITGVKRLKEMGIELINVASPTQFTEDTPTAELIRNVLGAIDQYDHSSICLRLEHGRQKKIRKTGKCGGMPSYQDTNPELVREARRLYRKSPKTGKRRTLRSISKELYDLGFTSKLKNPFSTSQIKRLVA